MSDNVSVTSGAGTSIATDDIGGVHYQRAKVTWGPDGTANDADVATGKPLPIQVRSATGLVPIGEPTDAKSTATDTTSASLISIAKQISASAQSLVTGAVLAAGSAIVGRFGIDQTTPGTTNRVDVGAIAGRQYEPVAASQTAQVLGTTGATGDDIDQLTVIPESTSPGSVTLLDNNTSIVLFDGGAESVTSLIPFPIGLGWRSVNGAWKVTTGASVRVVATGKFT